MIRRFALACALAATVAAPAGAADFYTGFLAAEAEDWATALKEWVPLAEEGNAGAQTNLGQMYARGIGVIEDHVIAAKYHAAAAEQGVQPSMFYMAVAFGAGDGVPVDAIQAWKWAMLCQKQGDPDIRELIPYLQASMTPEQKAEGQKLADAWKPKVN